MCGADSSTMLYEQWDGDKKNDVLGAQVCDMKKHGLPFRTRCLTEERAKIWTTFNHTTASFEFCSELSILWDILPTITSVRGTSPTIRTQSWLYYSSLSCSRAHLAHIRGASSTGLWPQYGKCLRMVRYSLPHADMLNLFRKYTRQYCPWSLEESIWGVRSTLWIVSKRQGKSMKTHDVSIWGSLSSDQLSIIPDKILTTRHDTNTARKIQTTQNSSKVSSFFHKCYSPGVSG